MYEKCIKSKIHVKNPNDKDGSELNASQTTTMTLETNKELIEPSKDVVQNELSPEERITSNGPLAVIIPDKIYWP